MMPVWWQQSTTFRITSLILKNTLSEKSSAGLSLPTYQQGLTPNPCIDCNSKVKFRELRRRATSVGYPIVATGHYAQIKIREGKPRLLRGADSEKDQSYFLYNLTAEDLSQTLFPVGHMTKPEVRELAKKFGLVTAEKPESQDICFVSGSAADFVERMGGKSTAGIIRDNTGRELGTHGGVHRFTVGQRRGLPIVADGEPKYVLSVSAATGDVIVGGKEQLAQESFLVREIHWHYSDELPETFKAHAQLRHRGNCVPVTVTKIDEGTAKVTFEGDWAVVTPGQACVIYGLDNREVLGGGRIS